MSAEEAALEREYVIPLRAIYKTPRWRRAEAAVRVLKEFVARHMKVRSVEIDEEVNRLIWSRGIENVPRKIRVRVVKIEEDRARVSIPEG